MDTIKAFIKKLIAYLIANPAFTFVIAACCVFIAILIVVVCVLYAKAKKAKNKQAQQTSEQSVPAQETEQTSATHPQTEVSTEAKTETVETVEAVETVETVETTNEETPAQEAVEEAEEAVETVETPIEEKEEDTPTTEETPVQAQESISQEQTQPETTIEATPIIKEETVKETPQKPTKRANSTRYKGKWTICHLLTKDENLGENNVEETYFFELLASNGEKLLSSEEYTSYNGALKGIETHKANIAKNNFRVGLSKKGEYIFKLLSGKNTLLCTGENYPTRLRCENAIESTKRFAQTAVLDENTHDIIVQIPLDDEEEPQYDQTISGKWIISKTTADDGDEVYYFELFASNGEKLLSSEEYTSYTGALNGIQTHKNNIEKDNFRITLTKRGDYIYKLLTGNGQLLCLGEHYKTRRRCESAVESVKRFAKNSSIFAASDIAPKD